MKLATYSFSFVLGVCSVASAAPSETSFTPVSIKVPLHFVRLENSLTNQGSEIYRCAAESMLGMPDAAEMDGGAVDTASECLVDMADNVALANLFTAPVDIVPGSYDRIRIYTCGFDGSQGYTAFVKGTASIAGTPYFTTNHGGQVLTTESALWDYTPVAYGGCAADVPLPHPVLVSGGDEIAISAFFSLRNLAWATLTGNGPPGGCAFNTTHTQNVCTAYPIPVTYLGSTSPTLE